MIISPGRRCELVKYFRAELNKNGQKLVALDMNKYAPALYFADKHYVVEKDFNNLEPYVNNIIEICRKEKVTFLLTLIDPELVLLSKYRSCFARNDIQLILSDAFDIKATLDKYLFYSHYKDKLSLVRTYKDYHEVSKLINAGKLSYPIFAKLTSGSASMGVHKVKSAEEFAGYETRKDFIYQRYIDGKEIGVDLYFDLVSGELVSVFMKEKLAMRAGETDKSVSIFREDVFEEMKKLAKCGNYRGPLDVDIFISKERELYLNEINPRFGGGYPHAHFCGVNFMRLIVNNMKGIENETSIGGYKLDVTMMKCNKFIFQDDGDLYN